ncbi:MAG: aspartate aminotransferase family protein, partial [Chloroflexota bacterium]|nr:aspartate aminotransferase family protein [Chloroflexota bacterium]
GESSVFDIALGQDCDNRTAGDLRQPIGLSPEELKRGGGDTLTTALELAMLLEGCHLFHAGGFLSVAHTEADVDETIEAFDRSIARLQEEGMFSA